MDFDTTTFNLPQIADVTHPDRRQAIFEDTNEQKVTGSVKIISFRVANIFKI